MLKQENQIEWSIKIVILVAIAFVITIQVVYGQGQLNNSTVAKPYSYRNELINRIMNSTCTEKRLVIGAEKPTSLLYLSTIEKIFKNCVAQGAIK
jgi:predicted phosphatase